MLEQIKEKKLECNRRLKRRGKKEKIPKWIRKLILNTPSQVGAYRSNVLRLSHIYFIPRPLRDLVMISASWSLEFTKLVVRVSMVRLT